MSDEVTWPRTEEAYLGLVRSLGGLLDVGRRLPELPFRRGGTVDICQFSHAIEGSFEPVLQALVDTFDDTLVSVAAFDPDPSVFHREYGTFGAVSIPAHHISETYWNVLSDSLTGELTYVANIVALVGDSGKWAVWAERSWDLAVLVSPLAGGLWLSRGVAFVSPEVALADFTEPDFKMPLSDADRTAFIANVRKLQQSHT